MTPKRLAAPLALALSVALVLGHSSPARATPPDPDPWLGPDKALHFGLSSLIAGGAYGVTATVTDDIRFRIVFGAGVALAAGASKELVDLAGYGDPSWKDFTWDVIGTAVGVGLCIALDVAIRGVHPRPRSAPAR